MMKKAVSAVELFRIKNSVLKNKAESDNVVIEQAITVQINQTENFVILCTPSDIKALITGFMFAEGIINDFGDIISISDCQAGAKLIAVQVKNFAPVTSKQSRLITSSRGLSGTRDIETTMHNISQVDKTLSMAAADLNVLIEKLHAKQEIFKETGGAHAAGIFDSANEIISFGEDIGRHNALDKAIGDCLLRKLNMRSCGVVLSSRISFEMVAKAARAGLEMIIAVSAPSSLAIEAAKKWNMTVCGFVRGKDANIYTGVERFRP
ncbi:MAG: formate dehydrogenase accessory sulfurtransferase FdhD [Candidatus Neomarinimicrobiota bacterium]